MKKLSDTPQRIYHRKAMARYAATEKGRAAIAAYKKRYAAKNAERLKTEHALYYQKNKSRFHERRVEHYKKNKAKIIAGTERWRKANREKVNAASMAWYMKNKAQATLIRKNYVKKYPERVRAQRLRRYARNSDAYTAALALYRAEKRNATPKWANMFFIGEAYHLAKLRTQSLGFPWHVDHIVPLKSKIVCGLHVENNLKVIPGVENIRKGNRFWPNMPETATRALPR